METDFLGLILPDSWDLALIFPLAVLYVLVAGMLAFRVKERFGLKTNYSRKIFHFTIFTTAFVMGYLFPLHRVAAFGAGAGVVMFSLVFFPQRGCLRDIYSALAREDDEPNRGYYLIVPFIATAIGGVVTGFMFPGYYSVGYLVSGWGDAAGEPVGVRYGKHRYTVPTLTSTKCTRSLEGSSAVFAVSFISAFIVLLMLGFGSGALLLALGAGALATAVEAYSPHGWDNLTVQVAACAGVFLMLAALD